MLFGSNKRFALLFMAFVLGTLLVPSRQRTLVGKHEVKELTVSSTSMTMPDDVVSEYDAAYVSLTRWAQRAPEGSIEQKEAQHALDTELVYIKHVDDTIQSIANGIYGYNKGAKMIFQHLPEPAEEKQFHIYMNCYRALLAIYESHCGVLSHSYGWKYLGLLSNMCKTQVKKRQFTQVAFQVCNNKPKPKPYVP